MREGMDGMTSRGINYWENADGSDRRLLFSMNDYLQAVDARTGKLITTFGDNGAVDLRDGLGRDPATISRIQSQTPGQVFENLLLLGSAPGEGYMSAPGHVRAFDVITGKQVWRFNTIPQPGEFGYDTWPQRRLQVHRRRQHLGRAVGGRRPRHRLLPDRIADLRLLRRRSAWCQPLRHEPAGARRPHRQAHLALPAGAPRPLGLRHQLRAAADDHHEGRPSAATSWRWPASQASSTCSTG